MLNCRCILRHPPLKGEEERKTLFGLPAPPPPPCTHGSSQWFILDGLVNHSIYFREDILHLASVTVAYQGKKSWVQQLSSFAFICSSFSSFASGKISMLQLENRSTTALGVVQDSFTLRVFNTGVWSTHTICCSSSCRQLCSSKKKKKKGEKKVLPFGPGPPVTLLVLSARLWLPAEQAWPEERRRLVPAGRVSGGRWM